MKKIMLFIAVLVISSCAWNGIGGSVGVGGGSNGIGAGIHLGTGIRF